MKINHLAAVLTIAVLTLGWADLREAHAQPPVYLEIIAEQDYASADPLAPFDILFIAHANGNRIQGMVFNAELQFSNGNILGVINEYPKGEAQIVWSPACSAAFASVALNTNYGQHRSSPDTLLIGLTSFGQPWKGSGEVFRIRVTPTDTGTVMFDWAGVPGAVPFPEFLDPSGSSIPSVMWNPVTHVPPQPGTVRFRISTSSGGDTLFYGVPGTIYFHVDAMGNEIAGLVYVLQWEFSNGNIVGHVSDSSGEITFSPEAVNAFESISVSSGHGQGTDPDSTLLGLTSFDAEYLTGAGWIWSVTFQPSDTGTIYIHPFNPGLASITGALDQSGGYLPSNFIPGRIAVVPCPYPLMGDVNRDGVLTSADLIYFINFQFKGGPSPLPDRSVADVNCSGGLSANDIIYLVKYVFKGGAPPCACIVRRL